MDKEPLLERRDGANSSRPPELRKNDVRERHSGETRFSLFFSFLSSSRIPGRLEIGLMCYL